MPVRENEGEINRAGGADGVREGRLGEALQTSSMS